ncbi:unnamed protein product, partial [Polarella glacialis]
ETFHWCFADSEEKTRKFLEKYGQPTEAQRLEVYNWFADEYDEGVKLVEMGGASNYRKELIQGALGDVLEVAVGTGRCFEALESAEVKSFVGVDINEAMLQQARKKVDDLPYPARVGLANAHKLPFADKSFDTVISSLCLCAVERPEEALAEMARVCRPGGQVLLVEPGVARRWLVRTGQRHLGLVPQPKHSWEFGWRDDVDVLGLLDACKGLSVASVETRAMGNWYLVSAKPVE